MKRVYIAGKLNGSAVDYISNVHRMLVYAESVRRAGYAVFIPCIDLLPAIMWGTWTYEDYFDNSQPWLDVSDAVFVCPTTSVESSPGVQKEIKRATERGIPVVFDIKDLP